MPDHLPPHPAQLQRERSHFREWAIPGPHAAGGVALGDDESLDALCGRWWIFQKKRGHRFSTDDVLCAWYASAHAPRVARYCDLGSGISSIALMVAWRLPGCDVVTLEAQEISLALARKSVAYNGVTERFTQLLGDLREPSELRALGPFDLVTGSPPYWAPGTALPAQRPQAEGARLETRGTVADYAKTAAQLLSPGGVFVCVFQAAHDVTVRQALGDAGLALVRTRPVCFKRGVPASESGAQVYLAMRTGDLPPGQRERVVEEPPLTIREPNGAVTAEYAAVKMSVGLPP